MHIIIAQWGTIRLSGTFRNNPDKTLDEVSEASRLILSFPESGEAPKEKMLHKTAREKSDWRRSDLTLLFCYISHLSSPARSVSPNIAESAHLILGCSGPRIVESIKSVAEIVKMYLEAKNKSPTQRKSKTQGSSSQEVAITMITLWVFFFLTALIAGLFGKSFWLYRFLVTEASQSCRRSVPGSLPGISSRQRGH